MNSHTQDLPIVEYRHGGAFTTTLAIAEGTQNQHKNVLELIRKHIADYEEFGLVAFETRARTPGQHGGGDTEYALLNEHQATLLITFMRNSPVVIEFKKRLVKAFFQMAETIRAMEHEALDTRGMPYDDPLPLTTPTNTAFDRVETPKLSAFLKISKGAAKAYLIACGVNTETMDALLARDPAFRLDGEEAEAKPKLSRMERLAQSGNLGAWCAECLTAGAIIGGRDLAPVDWPWSLKTAETQALYAAWCRANRVGRMENIKMLGAFLQRFGVARCRPGTGAARPWTYAFPELEEARGIVEFGPKGGWL